MTALARPNLRTLSKSHHEHDDDQRPLDFGLIARVYEFSAPYARIRNWLFVCVVLRSIQLPALTWVVAAVINGPVQRHDVPGVIWGAVGFALLALFTQYVMHYRQRLAYELGEYVVGDLRNALFAHIQRMPMGWFQKTKVGRIISRMTSDIEDVRIGVQEVLFVCVVQIGQMGVAAAAMLWYDWSLFLVVLALAPMMWLINRQFHARLSGQLRAMRESFSRITATLAESVLGIRVTQGFVRQEENSKIFHDLVEDHSTYNTTVMKTHGLYIPLLELNNQIFIAILLIIGGFRVLSPESTTQVGDVVGFLFMANLFFAPISTLGNQYNQAMTAMAGAERLFGLLDTPPAWSDPEDAVPLPRVRGRVEFRNLTFGYDPARPVLHGINFTAEPGQTIALVGHTGSGKSSIVNLIAKFYLPTSGSLLIDGHEITRITTDSLHHHIGVVLQQNFLFHGTVMENIRLGRPSATDDEVMQSAHQLDCFDMLASLPEGFHTQVGERGAKLSLGQRQLVCFCRALLANPQILLLDEATSSIDGQTEARLQSALNILLKGRTSFVVAHRLSTIRHADQVLVLDHGHIVERGRHGDLLAEGGIYAGLYRQFIAAG
jgi:ATP-binding cassette subfamily B protein